MRAVRDERELLIESRVTNESDRVNRIVVPTNLLTDVDRIRGAPVQLAHHHIHSLRLDQKLAFVIYRERLQQ